jgi:hypothetical protein
MSVNLGKPLRLRNDSGAQLELERGGIVRTLTVNASGVLVMDGTQNLAIVGGSINGTPIGGTTASTGAFTTLSASTSVTTPLVTRAGTLALSATGANVITASTNGLERMRIDSAGNVGIGTSSPTAGSHLEVAGTGTQIITLLRTDASTLGALQFNNGNSTSGIDALGAKSLVFGINNVEAMRITSAGTIQLPSGSPGIKFGSRNANLADYEEGTWTPVYAAGSGSFGTMTYSTQEGFYRKIGTLVYYSVRLATSNSNIGTATGELSISGLPFAASATQFDASSSVGLAGTFSATFTVTPESGIVPSGSLRIVLLKRSASNGPNEVAVVGDLEYTSASRNFITISGVYVT